MALIIDSADDVIVPGAGGPGGRNGCEGGDDGCDGIDVVPIANGLNGNCAPLVASAAAREDAVQIRRVTRMGLWLSILYSTGVFSLFWGSEFVFMALGRSTV